MPVRWLADISAEDVSSVGGKGASLGELANAGLPVPSAFVVTADTYRTFLETSGVADSLSDVLDVDPEDSAALADAADRAQELILDADLPEDVRETVLATYDDFGDDPFVAVRSSATAEDLPDASFAGQQETFLNVTRDGLLTAVKECWASLFTQRAIYYREKQGFDHDVVDIAVVVQRMVDSEKSGVMFTSHPSTGAATTIIEAAWGLGEGVVSGSVSPDNYVVDRETRDVTDVTVAEKKTLVERDQESGETVERDVDPERREERVLSDAEIDELLTLGERVEDHYGAPQDVEWAIAGGEVYMLQSRPITTIDENSDGASDAESDGETLVTGHGGSPGIASGPVRIVESLDELDKVGAGDIIVTAMTTPDMVPAMKRAAGIVTDEGGMTSHAAIVSRELGVPAVLGTGNATTVLSDEQPITINGDRGTVEAGLAEEDEEREPVEDARPTTPVKPMTATEVKVNVSFPEAAERAAATGADGVGLLRMEHMVLGTNLTPRRYVEKHGPEEYTNALVEELRPAVDEFYPRPVRVRTLDAPTDEFRELEGGMDEPHEHNPMLGYRGLRRSLDEPELFELELRAFTRLYEMGYDNVEVMFPLVTDGEDAAMARDALANAGVDVEKRRWGVMIETPAAALCVNELCDAGADFVSFGTNDLTQYTLAIDRNNELVTDRYDELHPSVLSLIADVIETCRERGVDTSICGQAASKPEMVDFLVEQGISSISPNVDAVRDVQHEAKRVEQRLLLDSVR